MSRRLRFSVFFLAGMISAQERMESPAYPLRPSDTPIDGWMREADPWQVRMAAPREASGSVSLQELRQPLKGDGLKMLQKAQKSFRAGDVGKGTELLREAMKNESARPLALGILGTEHIKQGQIDTAIAELEEAAHLLPGNAATHNNLAYALGLKGKSGRALEEARRALQLDPGNPKTRYVLGWLLLNVGDREEARYHLERAAAVIPSARLLLQDRRLWP